MPEKQLFKIRVGSNTKLLMLQLNRKKMKRILNMAILVISFAMVSCETSEDISNRLDHQLPDCKTVTLTANGQTKVIDDNIVTKLLWGIVPQTNMEVISQPTVTASKGSVIDVSVVISDNVGIKTAEMSYANWLFSKYINFSNPEGDIPLKPLTYTFTAQITVPATAISTPWLEDYYYHDGSSLKVTQAYHKIEFTVIDVNMNKRIIPIFVKVQ